MYFKSKELKCIARGRLSGQYRLAISAFLMVQLIILVVQMAFSYAMGDATQLTTLQALVYYLADFLITLVGTVLTAGLIYFHLCMARGMQLSSSMILYGFKNHPDRYIIGSLIQIVFIAIAMLPFIVVNILYGEAFASTKELIIYVLASALSAILAIIVGLNLFLFNYVLVDRLDLKLTVALKEAYELMKGHKGRLFYMELSFIGMILLGLCSLGLGLLWIIPYMEQTFANFYLDVSGQISHNQQSEDSSRQDDLQGDGYNEYRM